MKNVTFPVPTSRLEEFNKNILKLNRKATRLNFPLIGYTKSEPRIETQLVKSVLDEDGTEVEVEVVDITFDDVSLGFEDYELIGLTADEEGIDILHNFTEGLVDLTEERGTCVCDHCNHNRKRNKVYFVAKKGEDKNDFIRVGSTCVKDFFPKNSGDILGKFRFIEELFEFFGGGASEEFGQATSHVYRVSDILSLTCRLAREVVFTSATKGAEYGISCTRDGVTNILFDVNKGLETTPEDEAKAKVILEWFATTTEDSSYYENCREIIEHGYCGGKLIGYIVGLYGCWNHANNKALAAKSNNSTHVGTIGKRQTFSGKIQSIKTFEGYYGLGYITTVKCGEDVVVYFNLIKLKGFEYSDIDDLVGLEVQFDAMVKEHSEFNDIKQTIVARATKGKVLGEALVAA